MARPEVLVCHASTCRERGGEAVLTEIEELAATVGGCSVHAVGCLGYCNQAPNVLIRPAEGGETVRVRVSTLERSADVVARATGVAPDLDDETVKARTAGLRAARARDRARSVFKWNAALKGLQGGMERREILEVAGFLDGSDLAKMPDAICDYTRWTLDACAPVSKHSARFVFSSTDRKRGTPHPRGRGRMIAPVTWHTTLLAEVGANAEGPLPWIERDYTPVSTAHDWEQGRVELVVKIYENGLATSWLAKVPVGATVWLSRPVETLRVPYLVADGMAYKFRPASVLLVLAGTGVVALPQVLAHRDPSHKLRISTARRDQLKVPIDLVLSFREDDALLVEDVATFCREAADDAQGGAATGVRNLELLLTPAAADGRPPYPEAAAPDAFAALNASQNATITRARLDAPRLAEAYARMPQPCRVVVSGPDAFNRAARAALIGLVEEEDDLTLLSA